MILRTLLLLLLFSCHWISEAEAGGSHYHHRFSSNSSNGSNDSAAAVVIFVIFFVLFLLLLIGLGWWAWYCPGDPCYDSSYYYTGPYCSQLGYPHVCNVPTCRTAPGPPARHHPSTLDTTHYSYEQDPETGVKEQYRNVSF